MSKLLSLTVGILALCAMGRAESAGRDSVTQKVIPAKPLPQTEEQRNRALITFYRHEPHFALFARTFRQAQIQFLLPDPKSDWIQMITNGGTDVGDAYFVMLMFRIRFTNDFSKVVESKLELFGAYAKHAVETQTVTTPLRLSIDDIEPFCQAPEEFLKKKFESVRQR